MLIAFRHRGIHAGQNSKLQIYTADKRFCSQVHCKHADRILALIPFVVELSLF